MTTWINGSTRFAYDASTQLYEQPEATQQFLQFLLKWNQTLLQDKPVALRQPKTIGMTEVKDLQGLLQLGAKEQRSATAVFEVLVQELPHLPYVLYLSATKLIFQYNWGNGVVSKRRCSWICLTDFSISLRSIGIPKAGRWLHLNLNWFAIYQTWRRATVHW